MATMLAMFMVLGATVAVEAGGTSVSPVLTAKWDQMFKFYDVNNDNKLCYTDMDVAIKNLATANFKDAAQRKLLGTFLKFGLKLSTGGGTTRKPISRDDFRAGLKPMVGNVTLESMNDWFFTRLHSHLSTAGVIELPDFQTYHRAFGMSNADAKTAFDYIDIDSNKKADASEYKTAYHVYVLSDTIPLKDIPLFGSS